MKKNNPGCNCCEGRILVWDAGAPIITASLPSDPCQPATFFTEFFDGRFLKIAIDELTDPGETGDGAKIDFALNGETNPAGNFYGGPTPPIENENLDLESSPHWTGDIFDYDLVIYPAPISQGVDEIGRPGEDCFPHGPGDPVCPSDRWVKGGLPSWWEAIKESANSSSVNDPNLWSGRLVLLTQNSGIESNIGLWAHNIFLHFTLLPQISGLGFSIDRRNQSDDKNIFNNTPSPVTPDPLTRDYTAEGEVYISTLGHARSTGLSGGTILASNPDGGWTDGCDVFGTPVASWDILTHKTVGFGRVDIVLCTSYETIENSGAYDPITFSNTKKFQQNLFQVPVGA
jgi:hypothetical protein